MYVVFTCCACVLVQGSYLAHTQAKKHQSNLWVLKCVHMSVSLSCQSVCDHPAWPICSCVVCALTVGMCVWVLVQMYACTVLYRVWCCLMYWLQQDMLMVRFYTTVESLCKWHSKLRDTSLIRTVSLVPNTQSCVQTYLWIRDTSLYRATTGSQWCPL